MSISNNPPSRIYLQWYGEDAPTDLKADVDTLDVTWTASERIFDTDIEYARVRKTKRERAGVPKAFEIHSRFCGENGEPCQVCRLKAEREEKK